MISKSSQYIYTDAVSRLDEGEDAHDIASEIIRQFKERKDGSTLAIAESLTGGSVMAEITSVPGASSYFRGGIVTYATPLKHKLLGVDSDLIVEKGVVDAEVARQMAHGVRNKTAVHDVVTTWGLSTTGVAGPDAQDDKPVGMVFIGISHEEHGEVFGPFLFKGNRDDIRRAAALEALARLRDKLKDLTPM